jgi:phosphoglycerate dehydrogenase-like enzyme
VPSTVLFSPPLPKPITDLAIQMLPPGLELVALDRGAPGFAEAQARAEFFMGFARYALDDAFFRATPRLRLVQLISAGYDRVDLAAARRAKVPVANNGGSNSVAVAEHTMMLILATLKRLAWQHANVAAGKWRVGDFAETRLHELEGKTLGIVGLGRIGKKVARRARGFDCRILYHDIVRLTEDEEDALGVRFALLDELLRAADVVTLHVPLNEATRALIGARELALMKPTAVLINTCRGPVVDERPLFEALVKHQIAAAGLDVMTEEPPPTDNPILGLPNVTLTPHTAGPTWENWPKAFRNAFDNIQRVATGGRPLWVVPELRDLVGS